MTCLQVSDAVNACLVSDQTERVPGTQTINSFSFEEKRTAVAFNSYLLHGKK